MANLLASPRCRAGRLPPWGSGGGGWTRTDLEEIPESARTFDWYLEQARSLTASKRGEQALSVLEPLEGTKKDNSGFLSCFTA